mgnify:CR=1 FL=1
MSKIKVIAEVGSNHMGSLESAISHIEAAAKAGCYGVKFQLFRAPSLDSREEVQKVLRPLEMPLEWLPVLKNECFLKGLKLVVTPFSPNMADALCGYVDMVKISAYDLTYDDLIRAAARLGVPIILSTAMATIEEVGWATWWAFKAPQKILLHGVAAYPAEVKHYNLKCLRTISDYFDDRYEVGISDHTTGTGLAPLAVAAGATWIEKHFRLDTTPSSSPDFGHSVAPMDMGLLVRKCIVAGVVMGNGVKDGPLPVEMPLYETCRRTDDKPLRG